MSVDYNRGKMSDLAVIERPGKGCKVVYKLIATDGQNISIVGACHLLPWDEYRRIEQEVGERITYSHGQTCWILTTEEGKFHAGSFGKGANYQVEIEYIPEKPLASRAGELAAWKQLATFIASCNVVEQDDIVAFLDAIDRHFSLNN